MGYQILFSYHKKKDAGYDTDSRSTLTRRVGKDEEDTPLEQVVMVVKSQLARRDVLVVGVEIYEMVKKKVKFKEVKGGFVIKDKKFLMDQIQGITISADDDTPVSPTPQGLQPHEVLQLQQAARPLPPAGVPADSGVPTPLHPQRFEVYDPEPHHAPAASKYRLTKGKRYGIYREWSEGPPLASVLKYRIKDDRGTEVAIPADYFLATGKGLIGGSFDADPVERQLNKNLSFQGNFLEDGPVLAGAGYEPALAGGGSSDFFKMPDITHLRGKI